MTYKSIKTEVWRFILVPALTISLLLASTLTYMFIAQLHQFVEWRGHTIARNTALLTHQAIVIDSPEMLQPLLSASLQEHYVRGIRLHHLNGPHNYHLGPEFLHYNSEEGALPNVEQPTLRPTPRSLRFSHPLVDADGKDPRGWVEVEILTSPFIVMHYRTLMVTLLITIGSLLLSGFLAVRLHQSITRPIGRIKGTIDNLTAGKLQERIKLQECQEFNDLADAVNSMALSLEQAQQEMQHHVDQATEDLRETLETIEIQNIELNMARKEALEASRIKSEFLANTSHEIRTPLNGILGFTNLALKTELNDKQQEYLNTIRDSSQNLLTIINDILDFSKIEAGILTLDYAPLPLRKVIEETVQTLAPDAHEKNLQLVTLIDQNIPVHLLGDAQRFKQILSNLLSNAIKFSPEGNIIVDAKLLVRQDGQAIIKVSVSDEGIGLTESQKARLFNAFAQVDMSSAREHGGTGLGLAICKGLVERMGGEIGVDSKGERGATFWFTARLNIDKHATAAPVVPDLSNHRVLICSNSPASGSQLQHLLQMWQCECVITPAIHDIFIYLRQADTDQQAFSALILDIAPNERKIQPTLLSNLAEQLQEEFGCRIIVCCTPAHQRMFVAQSGDLPIEFVNKPITHDAMLRVLASELDITLEPRLTEECEPATEQHHPDVQVLVVDDNPANLQLAGELLRGLDIIVTQANSGKQALEICAEKHFDLIFMDIQMPGMDGIETTRRLREQNITLHRTPIIALTAHSMTEQKAELLIAGMDDCLSKPVSESQLAHMVNRWVNQQGKKDIKVESTNNNLQATQPNMPALDFNPDEKSPVDITLCLKLANYKPSLARDMLSMLIEGLAAEKAEINQSYEQKAYDRLEELVHRLYGSSCYCGVPQLKSVSGLLDKLLQKKVYDQIDSVINSLNNHIDSILAWSHQRDINALFMLETES